MPEEPQLDDIEPDLGPELESESPADESAPGPPADEPSPEIDADETTDAASRRLAEVLEPITEQLRSLNDRAAHREAVIDRLHAENETLKDGRERKLMEPIVASLIRLIGHMEGANRRASEAGEDTVGIGMLQGFIHEIEDVLDSCGMHRARPIPGELFDPQHHQVKGREEVGDEALHNTVIAVASDGFIERGSGRAFQRSGVIVARYEPPSAAEHVAAELAADPATPAGDPTNGSANPVDDGLSDTQPENEQRREQT